MLCFVLICDLFVYKTDWCLCGCSNAQRRLNGAASTTDDTDTHLLEHTSCLSPLDLHSWSRLLHQRVRLHLSHLYCAFTLKTMRHHWLISGHSFSGDHNFRNRRIRRLLPDHSPRPRTWSFDDDFWGPRIWFPCASAWTQVGQLK